MTINENNIENLMQHYIDTWHKYATSYLSYYKFLLFIGILSSIILGVFLTSLDDNIAKLLAFTSSISYALISGFEMQKRASNYRDAWRLLNASLMKYTNSKSISKDELITVYEEAEKIIGNYTTTVKPAKPKFD